MNYLIAQKHRDPDFYFDHKRDGGGHMTGVLWCDFQSQMDYRAFGDVVVFDGTYKTNKYNLSLGPFVGVNHHKSTVLFACGIVAHEDTQSYVWLLTAFTKAMSQKHPVSAITDGELAMQNAINIAWPNASHWLCGWHIENNIVSNIKDDGVKEGIRCFLYARCSIEEIELKWMVFLKKHEVIDENSWLYQMYERRESWCTAYHAGKHYLGLRSNQRSESLHSRIQFNLDRKMTLLVLFQHSDNYLVKLRTREATLDFVSNYKPCLEPDASFFVHEAAKRFTTSVFYDDVLYNLKAAEKCYLIEELDSYDTIVYEVGRVDKGEKRYYVSCDIRVDVDKVKEISYSCLKLQFLGTPCSHIFFVLGYREENKLPDCCVLKGGRWVPSVDFLLQGRAHCMTILIAYRGTMTYTISIERQPSQQLNHKKHLNGSNTFLKRKLL
jgi:zinc finger SWIM domain-containing protein 3